MPYWLRKQLKAAFFQKNRYQIKLLNQCWFYYQKTHFKRNTAIEKSN
ncbi:cortex morphogenetic protein CmpA [Alkalihalobacterium chitinilyticum]|uniref:Cortex morphogenetic protein CmpA n=1 Tax=Alkalihalobacterium chitinilyticum TaxID=2980103 RepID=A0ABT5VKX2_9BACI|nr:cortex morphogenetic protein CmpA [Alkalihalobacterium chitinilyticum]MDE5416074.1 cortex morphogenetic protein CmpA [Alkalihalobacterium chitinilyticum]